MTPPEPAKPPFRWRAFWIGVAITLVVLAALDALNPFGFFDSLGS
jgi:hypothetical protein